MGAILITFREGLIESIVTDDESFHAYGELYTLHADETDMTAPEMQSFALVSPTEMKALVRPHGITLAQARDTCNPMDPERELFVAIASWGRTQYHPVTALQDSPNHPFVIATVDTYHSIDLTEEDML